MKMNKSKVHLPIFLQPRAKAWLSLCGGFPWGPEISPAAVASLPPSRCFYFLPPQLGFPRCPEACDLHGAHLRSGLTGVGLSDLPAMIAD